MSSGSPAMIISYKGITDQTTRNRFGFFIPWEDILLVDWDKARDYKYVIPGRYGMRRAPQHHIYLLLRAKAKYVPESNKAIQGGAKGPIYDIPCFQLDISHDELLGIIEDRIAVRNVRNEHEDEYMESLYRLRGKGP